MFYDFKKAHAVVDAIDWYEIFREYERIGVSVGRFYNEHFAKLCSRYTKIDYVPSLTTVYKRLQKTCRKVRLQEAAHALAEQQASTVTVEQEIKQAEPSETTIEPKNENVATSESKTESIAPSAPTTDTNSDLVSVFEIDDLISNDEFTSEPPSEVPSYLRQAPPIPSQCLITELKGMKFTFACRDPTETLIALLIRLNNKMEEKHAH